MRRNSLMLVLLSALAFFCAGAVFASDVEVSGGASVTFEGDSSAGGGVSAVARWVKGDVLVKREGAVVWEKLEEGMELHHGDVVETKEGASALLAVGDWSYVKLSPMSTVAFQMAKSGDKTFRLVTLENGKMWGSLKRVEEEDDPLVVQLPGGFVDGKETTFFVEAAAKDNKACVDMLSGEMSVRSSAFPDEAVPLAKNTRAHIKKNQEIGQPEKLSKTVKENDMNHSCLAAEEKEGMEEKTFAEKTEAAKKGGSAEYVSLTGTAIVIFGKGKGEGGEMEDVLLFGKEKKEEEGEGRWVLIVGGSMVTFVSASDEVKLSDDDAVNFLVEKAEAVERKYEIIEITGESKVEFVITETVVAAAGDCAISGVSISAAESEVGITGTTIKANVCGPVTLMVEPAAVTCAAGAKYDGWALSVNGGTPATYGVGTKAELKFENSAAFSLKLYAVSAAENKEYSAFELTNGIFQKGPEKPAAEITGVGGAAAGEGKIVLDQNALDGGKITVRGDGFSYLGCGIQKALVSTDNGGSWKDATVSGDGSWEYGFTPSEGAYFIKAKVVDEKGVESDVTGAVEVEYKVAEEVAGAAGDCAISGASISAAESEVGISGNTITAYVCGEVTLAVEPSGVACSGGATYDGWALSVSDGVPATYGAGTKAELKYDDPTTFTLKLYAVNAAENREYSAIESSNISFVKGPEKPVAEITGVGGADAGGGKIVLDQNALDGGNIVVAGEASSLIGCGIDKVQVSLDNGGTWKDAAVSGFEWEYAFAPSAGTYYITAMATDEKGGVSDKTATVEVEYQQAAGAAAVGDCVIGGIEITAVSPDGLDVSDTAITQTVCGAVKVQVAPSAVSCDDNASYDRWAFKPAGGVATQYGAAEKAEWTLTQTGLLGVELYLVDSGNGVNHSVYETEVEYVKNLEIPGITIIQAGNAAVEDYSTKLSLYSDALESGYLKVRGEVSSPSECEITKVRVSMNDGASWGDATVTSGSWEYRVSPAETTYYITADAEDAEGNKSEEMYPAIEVEYRQMRIEDELRNVFDQLLRAYLNKDTIGFMDLTSSSFSSDYEGLVDGNLLENSLENKFIAYPTISLRYKVTNTIVTGTAGRVVFDWSADTGTTGYQYSGTFLFEQDPEWQFTSVEDNNTFLRYTSAVKTISLSAAETTLIADEADNTTIAAVVRDSANNFIKDGTIIYFSATTGAITASAATLGGVAEATYTAGFMPGTATITASSSNGVSAGIPLTLQPERAPLPPAAK